jgi:hypothetical protein
MSDDTPPDPLNVLVNIVAIRDGYLFVPSHRRMGESPDFSEARHASTPQALGEKIGLWLVEQELEK